MVTSTEMINTMINNFAQLFTDSLPILYFLLGLFIALFAIKFIIKGFKYFKWL